MGDIAKKREPGGVICRGQPTRSQRGGQKGVDCREMAGESKSRENHQHIGEGKVWSQHTDESRKARGGIISSRVTNDPESNNGVCR